MSTTAEAPTFVAASTRLRLSDIVPYDEFRVVRLALMFEFLFIYLWWLRIMGLPVDRISVAISVGIFLICAFIGRSWRTWGVLLLDCLAYSVMWWTYEATRGAADDGISVLGLFRIKFPRQIDSIRDIDRVMFFGNDPNVVLQDHFWEPSVRWYDVVASTTYMTHFVLPIIIDGRAVGDQPSSVGALHEAVRHPARRCVRAVRAAADGAAVDGRRAVRPVRPAAPRRRPRVPSPRLQGIRQRLPHRPQQRKRSGGDAIAARVVRVHRAAVLLRSGSAADG